MNLLPPVGVLLLGFGGPSSQDEVEPFLKNLLGKSLIPPRQLKAIKSRYQLIGGGSPLLDITIKQARALEKKLLGSNKNLRVYLAMRYWHPSIEDALSNILSDGITRIIALSLTPHSSYITTNAYHKELKRVSSLPNHQMHISTIGDWYNHPLFLEAIIEKINEGMKQFPEEKRKDIPLVFSAHSLPDSTDYDADSYKLAIETTIRGIIKEVEPVVWQLAFQSRGRGEGWLEPKIEKVVEDFFRQGFREAMIVPISFVSDHMETLYDLDIALKDLALSWNMTCYRSPCLNDSPKFIEALASLVLEHLKREEMQ